jgi:hypothetical protein
LKVVFVTIIDPIAWRKPDTVFFEEDLEWLGNLEVLCTAGILIKETEEVLILGEVHTAVDNKALADAGVDYPRFRDMVTIAKKNIIERYEFEVKRKPKRR